MTPADAKNLQNDSNARGTWLVWVVTATDLEHPGKFTARPHTADHQGGKYLPGALVGDTLAELQAQLPNGLACRRRASIDPPEVVEVWD